MATASNSLPSRSAASASASELNSCNTVLRTAHSAAYTEYTAAYNAAYITGEIATHSTIWIHRLAQCCVQSWAQHSAAYMLHMVLGKVQDTVLDE